MTSASVNTQRSVSSLCRHVIPYAGAITVPRARAIPRSGAREVEIDEMERFSTEPKALAAWLHTH